MKNGVDQLSTELNQRQLLLEYFKAHPHKDIPHPEIVDYVTEAYKRQTGKVFRDPDRAIRKLHQEGFLMKVSKGVYRYDPENINMRELQDFTPAMKKAIFARDHYRCVICGKGLMDGVEIHVDHIKPKDKGGLATIENGQTLCGQHNYMKKNFNQTETGKKMFLRLYELAKKQGNQWSEPI